jgi:hypothetical protein
LQFSDIYPFLKVLPTKTIETTLATIDSKKLAQLLKTGLSSYLLLEETPDGRTWLPEDADLKQRFYNLFVNKNSEECNEILGQAFHTSVQGGKCFPEPKTPGDVHRFKSLVNYIPMKAFLSTNWMKPTCLDNSGPTAVIILYSRLVTTPQNALSGHNINSAAMRELARTLNAPPPSIWTRRAKKQEQEQEATPVFSEHGGGDQTEQRRVLERMRHFFSTIDKWGQYSQTQVYNTLFDTIPNVLAHGYMHLLQDRGAYYTRHEKFQNLERQTRYAIKQVGRGACDANRSTFGPNYIVPLLKHQSEKDINFREEFNRRENHDATHHSDGFSLDDDLRYYPPEK